MEEGNTGRMYIHLDGGLFHKLYERSAFAFCTRIRSFKVNVKTIQGLDAPFVSIGVPVNRKEEYRQGDVKGKTRWLNKYILKREEALGIPAVMNTGTVC